MSNRGQTVIEYLMTYAWSFLLLITIIGIMIFILNPTQDRALCKVNKPTQFLAKAADLPHQTDFTWNQGKISMQNATAGSITIEEIRYKLTKSPEDCIPRENGVTCTRTEGSCTYTLEFTINELNKEALASGGNFPMELSRGRDILFENILFELRESGSGCNRSFEKINEYRADPMVIQIQYLDQFEYANDVNLMCTNFPLRI